MFHIVNFDFSTVDTNLEKDQIEFLKSVKERRDSKKVAKHLSKLREIAGSDANIIPTVIDCVESMVTVGEICQVLREMWGEYKENVVL